jgi:hypothetical protein
MHHRAAVLSLSVGLLNKLNDIMTMRVLTCQKQKYIVALPSASNKPELAISVKALIKAIFLLK